MSQNIFAFQKVVKFELKQFVNLKKLIETKLGGLYIDGSCPVDRINDSLVPPVNRPVQSDGFSVMFMYF